MPSYTYVQIIFFFLRYALKVANFSPLLRWGVNRNCLGNRVFAIFFLENPMPHWQKLENWKPGTSHCVYYRIWGIGDASKTVENQNIYQVLQYFLQNPMLSWYKLESLGLSILYRTEYWDAQNCWKSKCLNKPHKKLLLPHCSTFKNYKNWVSVHFLLYIACFLRPPKLMIW